MLNEKTIVDLMAALIKMFDKPSSSNKILMELFNMMMVDRSSMIEHLNNFNTNIPVMF